METIRHFILNPKEAASISTSMPHASICRRSQFLPCSYHGVNGRLVQPGGRQKSTSGVALDLSPRFCGVDFLTLMMDEEEGIPIRRIEK